MLLIVDADSAEEVARAKRVAADMVHLAQVVVVCVYVRERVPCPGGQAAQPPPVPAGLATCGSAHEHALEGRLGPPCVWLVQA